MKTKRLTGDKEENEEDVTKALWKAIYDTAELPNKAEEIKSIVEKTYAETYGK